jgi:hypothetical protein
VGVGVGLQDLADVDARAPHLARQVSDLGGRGHDDPAATGTFVARAATAREGHDQGDREEADDGVDAAHEAVELSENDSRLHHGTIVHGRRGVMLHACARRAVRRLTGALGVVTLVAAAKGSGGA